MPHAQQPAQSEWLKVMLGEVARKQEEAALERAEAELRRQESAARAAEAPPASRGRGRRR